MKPDVLWVYPKNSLIFLEKSRVDLIVPRYTQDNLEIKKSLDLREKSLDLSNYEIFPHKILKSRTFKKSSILIVIKPGFSLKISLAADAEVWAVLERKYQLMT